VQYFNYDLSAKISHSKFLIFTDLKIYQDIKSVEGCKSLQAGIDSIQQCCSENCMKLLTFRKLTLRLSQLRLTVSI
jgi:hypothetical protein